MAGGNAAPRIGIIMKGVGPNDSALVPGFDRTLGIDLGLVVIGMDLVRIDQDPALGQTILTLVSFSDQDGLRQDGLWTLNFR